VRIVLFAGFCVLVVCGAAHATGYSDLSIGIAANDRDDSDAALAALTRALSEADLPPGLKPVAYVARGEANAQKKKYDAALADFNVALSLYPGYLDAYKERARAYSAMGRYSDAAADETVLIAAEPYKPDNYLQRAFALASAQRFVDAISDCDTILSLWPKTPIELKPDPQALVYWMRGDLDISAGKYDQAISDESTAIEKNDMAASAYADRGVALVFKGKFKDAISDFHDALDRGDKNAISQGSLLGGVDLNVSPGKETIALNLGLAEWSLNDMSAAHDAFVRALKIEKANAWAVLGLAISQSAARGSEDVTRESASVDLTKWPGPILSLWLGKSTEEQVRSAITQGDTGQVAQRRCAADFYVGEWHVQRHEQALARSSLHSAASDCPLSMIEMKAAEIDAGRIGASEAKP
jgi:tetratricopeptide (TPR) repeat protein